MPLDTPHSIGVVLSGRDLRSVSTGVPPSAQVMRQGPQSEARGAMRERHIARPTPETAP